MSFSDKLRQSINKGLPKPKDPDPISLEEENFRLRQENRNLRDANLELLETLGAVVDSLYPHTVYHSAQVAVYALHIARKLGLSEQDQEAVFQAGLVHDVGIISLASTVTPTDYFKHLRKYENLQAHPTISGEIIGRINLLRQVAPLVHHHHERFDGAGYPDRLKGEEIPLGARILNLADTIDVMLTDQPSRAGFSLEEVVTEVKRWSGSQFDPRIVDAFVQLAAELGEEVFSSPRKFVEEDMLLTTVGIRSGRAMKAIKFTRR